MKSILRIGKRRLVNKAVARHSGPGGVLDVRLGLRLLAEPRVPIPSKLVALAIGLLLTSVLIAAEIPLEALLSLLVPALGFAGDLIVDGIEMLVFPLLFACVLLRFLAPRQVVDALRSSA